MKLKKLLAVAFSAVIMGAASALTAFADPEANIKIEQPKKKGDTFNVTVSVDADEDIGYMQSQLYYDERVIEYVSGDAVGGGGLINLQGFPNEAGGPVTLELQFQVVGEGSTDISVENCLVFSLDGVVIGQPEASQTVALTDTDDTGDTEDSDVDEDESSESPESSEDDSSEDDSSDTDETGMPASGVLIMLMTDNGVLEPEFKFDVFDYEVYVDNSVEEVVLTPVPASPDDKVTISGDDHCEVGENRRTITVVGDDDIAITYTITIIRAEPEAVSSEESSEVVSEQTEETISSDVSSEATSSGKTDSNTSEPDKYKRLLNPALAIVLVVLVVSLVIILMWISSIRKKNKRRRRR